MRLNEIVDDLVIAIDGPAGAGKSTVAKIVADKLGYIYIDTGAMYRALTLKALRRDIDLDADQEVVQLAQKTEISFRKQNGVERVLLDKEDVTEEIRSEQVSEQVSTVASIPQVREELVEQQRALAANWGVVMDGRDIGTVVLPAADLKIFLTASLEERARRRYQQLDDQAETSLEAVKQKIKQRDQKDRNREVAPLKKAPSALKIDTTEASIEEVVAEILKLAKQLG